MTVTCVPSVFVTCASQAAALLLLSFSVVAMSTVPPALAIAAAVTFARTSPVRGVSGVRAGTLPVVVFALFLPAELPPAARVAPARASAARTAAPAVIVQSLLRMHGPFVSAGLHAPRDHSNLGKPSESPMSELRPPDQG